MRRDTHARTRRHAGRTLLVAILAGLGLLLAACSGVPSSSRPETIRPVTGDSPTSGIVDQGPVAGADSRAIVVGFLAAAASSSDAHHSGARQYLTTAAGSRWQDNTVTILGGANAPVPQNPEDVGDEQAVSVTGEEVGSVDPSGVYTPQLPNKPVSSTFTLKRENNAWRIDTLDPGVLIGESTFNDVYSTQPIYFLYKGSVQPRLVSDLRYSALKGQELGEWLLAQLLAGPSQNLAPSVTSALPPPDVTRKATVTVSDQDVALDIPGAAQLDAATLRKLAAQLAYTFGPIVFSGRVSLSDAGKPVNVPDVGSATFSKGDFPSFDPEAPIVNSKLYYLRSGGLVDGVTNKAVPGPVGNASAKLSSVSLRLAPGNVLRVAALSGNSLLMGDASGPLSAVSLPPGPLSRPEFRPGSDEVWIGVGSSIYRVGTDRVAHLVSTGGPIGGRVLALQFSPDGARIGVVLQSASGGGALWAGSVVLVGAGFTIGTLAAITPAGLRVTDVAWSDATHLLFIGALDGGVPQVWTVQCDGYALNSLSSTGLTRGLLSIAAAPGQPTVVVTDGPAIWEQLGGSWQQPAGSEASTGSAPAYAS
ncbi:MAG: hypothetical protein JWO63_1842 [Frankiales bacterium]|nr:hypothetical protein [Frankiales bacterium]